MIKLEEMSMLTTLYSQPQRHYHNINHINDCLVELENIPKDMLSSLERSIIETAIWYHDAVYNPYSKKNEANSAWLFSQRSNNETPFGKTVYETILATANHLVTQTAIKSFYIDNKLPLATQLMLDIDLAGFGKPWKECLRNAANIRKEYYNTEELEFQQGRLKFLETISKRESLYYTDYFKEKYHTQSQKNLIAEIQVTLARIDVLNEPSIW